MYNTSLLNNPSFHNSLYSQYLLLLTNINFCHFVTWNELNAVNIINASSLLLLNMISISLYPTEDPLYLQIP